jgi:hypothetical protein
MSSNSQEHAIFEQLIDVFDQVKSALKAGEITDLGRFSTLQDELRVRLESIPKRVDLSEIQINTLVLAAKHNQRLLNAALAGIKSAAARRSEIRDAAQSSQTYNRTGTRIHLVSLPGSCEKRS